MGTWASRCRQKRLKLEPLLHSHCTCCTVPLLLATVREAGNGSSGSTSTVWAAANMAGPSAPTGHNGLAHIS